MLRKFKENIKIRNNYKIIKNIRNNKKINY